MARKYELRKRAERIAETRQRVVEAAVALHTTLGPAATSISAIAARAGVQRHTVYAHFPDNSSLFRACSAHWAEQHPMPDFASALAAAEPAERVRQVLRALYGWYAGVEDHLALFHRDTLAVPELAARREANRRTLRDELARGCDERTRAAIGHALQFPIWRSLVRDEGLSQSDAVDLMVGLAFGGRADGSMLAQDPHPSHSSPSS
jgi:AcrR family transcriptional regulator